MSVFRLTEEALAALLARRRGRPTPDTKAPITDGQKKSLAVYAEVNTDPSFSPAKPARQASPRRSLDAAPEDRPCGGEHIDTTGCAIPRAAGKYPPVYPLVGMCRAAGLPEPVPEYRFHPTRKWRLDFAWPLYRVGVEIDGGVWTQGRHTRGSGFVRDMEKLNAAVVARWAVLRYTPDQLPQAIFDLRALLLGPKEAA